jgi:3-dehydroquinate synthase
VTRAHTVRYPAIRATSRIVIRRGALDALGRLTCAATSAERVVLVTDSHVGPLHGARARVSLRRSGIAVDVVVIPAGESSKSAGRLVALWETFARLGLGRRAAVVALGGGVVGDLAGFAAATWLRGVPWVVVPTSLLAQVDASVGGKTAIDLEGGKNLAGAFHQPALVVADPELLSTLPARQRRAGLAEVAKMGMAVDAGLFAWLERHATALRDGRAASLEAAVRRAVAAKLAIVRRDPWEREGGPRTALNYGHTLAHAIEAANGYARVLHGEAVAVGMRAAAELSVRVAGLPEASRVRQDALLDALGLPRRMPPTRWGALRDAMGRDKKRSTSSVRWVLTPRIGHASVPRPIATHLVRAVVLRLGARAGSLR